MQKYGFSFAHSGPIQYACPGEIKICTGHAGDCMFFDAKGFHSAVPCKTGKRLVLVVLFEVFSKRNKMLDSINAI